MKFEKWTALGNDYILIEQEALPWELTEARIKRLCDPHFGIGSDGILLLSRSEEEGVIANLRIFNPDGSEAELSGNGAREAVMYLRRAGWTSEGEFAIRTAAGLIRPTITGERTCTLEMGKAGTSSPDFPSGGEDGKGVVESAGREWAFQHVSIGNPQCAIAAGEELESLDLAELGPPIETNPLFPNRTNASFYRLAPDAPDGGGTRIRARIFERGVGETLSSGTGASGAAVAAVLAGAASPVLVELDGGDLTVEVSAGLDVRLSGSAEPLYSGELSPELREALAAL